MNILERLKRFLKRDKSDKDTPLLTDGQISDRAREFRNDNFFGTVKRQPTLEECIDEFIKQYRIQDEYGKDSMKKPYHAYSRMFCGEEVVGDNFKNQKRLIKLVKKNDCIIGNQVSSDRVVYMHISGKEGIDEKKDPNMEKIYINCEREDISIITAAIFKQIKGIAGDKLQMKCISEQRFNLGKDEETKKIKNYQRNDRIVIYTENHEKTEEICNSISLLRKNNPKIFKGIKSIPLLENKDGFMVVSDKKDYELHTKTPLGDASGLTFNDYVSDVLYQSVISAFDKEFQIESNDSYKLNERMSEYARIYPEIEQEQKKRILESCSHIFRGICKDANIKLSNKQDQQQKDVAQR